MAFDTDVNLAIREQNIPMLDQAGVFYTVLIPKSDEEKKSFLRELKPKVWNELPVNLEEVFIAKFEGSGDGRPRSPLSSGSRIKW